MNYKEFIQKYEELLNSGYCECNELNCLDNNPPKKILNIMKEQQQEIERLNNIINELSKENQELKEKTKLFHKNGVFSLEYDKETLRDMVLEYQEKIDKAVADYEKTRCEKEQLNSLVNSCQEEIRQLKKHIQELKGSDKE